MSKVYLSIKAIPPLKKYLNDHNMSVTFIGGEGSNVDSRIATHADLYMCQLGLGNNADIYMGNRELPSAPYPGDAIYNAVITKQCFIHNLKVTDNELAKYANDLYTIDVKQGYTRCNCLPVNDTSFITPDRGIANALIKNGYDVLTISPGCVNLTGFPYGFLPGTAGNLLVENQQILVFNGDLSKHPDYEAIADFARNRNVEIKFFEGYPLEDIGSIIYSNK